MFPIKTYLDIADDTYMRGESIEKRRDFARLEVRDSNTVGKDYLRMVISFNAVKYPEWTELSPDGKLYSGIRLHRGQVKRLIKALQRFVKESEETCG